MQEQLSERATAAKKNRKTMVGGSAIIARVAKTSRAKGRENDEKIARWVYQFGHTTDDILRRLLGVLYPVAYKMSVDNGDNKKKVKGKGLIQPVNLPAGFPRTFVLTEPGVRLAHKHWNRESLKYPWPRSQLSRGDILHCHDCQNVAIIWGGNAEVYYEREFKDGTSGALPDLIIKRDGIVEWHEIERNGKSGDRLLFQIQERVEALLANRFNKLIWHFDSKADEIAVRKIISLDSIPYIVKHQNSYSRDSSRPGVNPSVLLKRTEFYRIDNEVTHYDRRADEARKDRLFDFRVEQVMEAKQLNRHDAIAILRDQDEHARLVAKGMGEDEIKEELARREHEQEIHRRMIEAM